MPFAPLQTCTTLCLKTLPNTGKMFLALLLVLQDIAPVSALLTVVADRHSYDAVYSDDVTLACRFQPVPPSWSSGITNYSGLSVTWHRVEPIPSLEVYRFASGLPKLTHQHRGYKGRVRLLTEELKEGWVKLQVSQVRLNDSGKYQCLVDLDGTDYKHMALSVDAPYRNVTKNIQTSPEGDEVQLTCQSEGYPLSAVTWTNGDQEEIPSNYTTIKTPDLLFRVTSLIQVSSSHRSNYTCSYGKGGPSATFDIPDEIPVYSSKRNYPVGILTILPVLAAIFTACLFFKKWKGSNGTGTTSTRNLIDCERNVAAPCLPTQPHMKEQSNKLIKGPREGVETLKEALRAHYTGISFGRKAGQRHGDPMWQDAQPQRLYNSENRPVTLQALLPGPRETFLLEGPPGSGKTNLAQILVSSWARGPSHSLTHLRQLQALDLVILVDCSGATGELFQEIRLQLPAGCEMLGEEDLRTVLGSSGEVLLVLDGYREGNHALDKSLMEFLAEEQACRVLVMACSDHCLLLKERVRKDKRLWLQMLTTGA